MTRLASGAPLRLPCHCLSCLHKRDAGQCARYRNVASACVPSDACARHAECWMHGDYPGPASAKCGLPPAGWKCTRARGHDGPCAAYQETFFESHPELR